MPEQEPRESHPGQVGVRTTGGPRAPRIHRFVAILQMVLRSGRVSHNMAVILKKMVRYLRPREILPLPTETPHVHGLTTPTHARRRAGHPLAGGRLYRQAKRRANHLGQTRELLAQETEHIGGRRQTGMLAR